MKMKNKEKRVEKLTKGIRGKKEGRNQPRVKIKRKTRRKKGEINQGLE